MRLIVLGNGTHLGEVVCHEQAVYIGSDEQCEIRLPHEELSPQIGVIYAEDDGVWVFEQIAENEPVHFNGALLKEKVRIAGGDQIKVGDYIIRAEVEAPDIPVEPAPEAQEPSKPGKRRVSVARLTQFVSYQLPPGSVLKKADDDVRAGRTHLVQLGAAGVAFGQCATVEELMERGIEQLFHCFGAQRVWMGVRRVNYGGMEYVEGRLVTGKTAGLPEPGEKLMPRILDRSQFVLLPRGDESHRCPILAGPLLGGDGPIGMAYLDAGPVKKRYGEEDLDFFILVLNALAAQLDAIFKEMARTRAAMLEGEVAVAHAIQARLTPRKLPQWNELQFGAFREMGRERSSDIYDVVRLPNQMALFMIAQTTATGPLPSMLMAQAQAAFRVAAMHLDAPHLFLKTLNALMYDGQQDHPLDCFVGVIEPPTGQMRYARAGQIGAYIISNRGEERFLGTPQRTPPLGVVRDATYNLHPERLEPGETLAMFTAGVARARNAKGQVFGEDRFINILCDGFGQLASNMLKEMLHDLQQFTEAGTQPDDITVLLAHRP